MAERAHDPDVGKYDEMRADARGEHLSDSSTGRNRRRSERGFASMDPAKQREIASKGGRAAHQKGTAHEFSSEEARAAGRKGGEKVSQNREHMSKIGSRGGRASHERGLDDEDEGR